MNCKPSVLLISIDALKPEFVFDSERIGVNLPNLKKYFVENGTYASKGVKSVFPTFTYTCHHSMITGTYPATHGIHTNTIFDPTGKHKDAWYWYVSEDAKNLWECAKENGYISSSVGFPASVGANSDYHIPEIWRDGTHLDSKLIDAVSRPQGIVREMEKEIGQFAGGTDLTIEGDTIRQKAALWILDNKIKKHLEEKPFFMSCYYASYDETAHIKGVYSKEAISDLERIDALVGELVEKAHEITNNNVVVCVVSDHGTIDNKYDIKPNIIFAENKLIEVDKNGKLLDWSVWCQRSGGTGQIRLKDKDNKEVRTKVKGILNELLNDENSGISEVITGEEAKEIRRGFPDADYVIISKAGYEVREDTVGEYLDSNTKQKAQHGYCENLQDMRASFYIEGVNIEKNKDIEELRLVDVAPTLAKIMGFEIPTAEGKNILN
ncbi:alkaline phosphatase family protein [Romboutsia weinsteinii]|uniref:Alkaline phosphatase family protein n=1 Tax=Romboutsia weinsteinii TaxID=2020949 RepID=A0A371J725_9FIRM|nr:ectonucleotide pyrophosphatase/phosphodiesterase [Romboutsia weinsteinii]RDY28503.1 alkaline phosphatase family protein [Romboutsia weinsteinii]